MAHGKVNERYFVQAYDNGTTDPHKPTDTLSVSEDEFGIACKTHDTKTNPNAKVGIRTFDSETGVRCYTTLYLFPIDLKSMGYTPIKGTDRMFEKDETTPKAFTKNY